MFTGLIEELGTVRRVSINSEGCLFEISAEKVLERLAIGDSIAIDGTCLSVVSFKNDSFTAQAVQETINRSTLKHFRVGTKVNLERAMPADGHFGGHFVQGHVDGIAAISRMIKNGRAAIITIDLPAELMRYIILKGSVAIDGISLTVAEKFGNRISVSVIPLTLKDTSLSLKKSGDLVNIEVDMMAKYVENIITGNSEEET
ncbi:MAG: riboflavin synthase, partial [Candidatus Marinimicrobia bacterium]|nr:riboflavin synthase [Candidatus Neomarinimicrobiota bacterium]